MRKIGFILAAVVACTMCPGCAINMQRGLEKAERDAVLSGESKLLIVGVQATVDGEPMDVISESKEYGRLGFTVGEIEDMKMHYIQAPQVVPGSNSQRGWCYFLLKPGSHVLSVGSVLCRRDLEMWRGVDLLIEIPQEADVVYAGTLRVNAKSYKLLFGQSALEAVEEKDVTVIDQRDDVPAAADRLITGAGKIRTILAERYRTRLAPPKGARLVLQSEVMLKRPNLTGVGVENFAAPGVVVMVASTGGGGPGAGAVFVVGGGLAIIGAGIGAAFGTLEAEVWKERFNLIASEVASMEPAALLRDKLAKEGKLVVDQSDESNAPPWTCDPPVDESGPMLQVRLEKIQIVPCHGEWGSALCVQVWARARVWDAEKKQWRGDRYLIYSYEQTRQPLPVYAIHVTPYAARFKLDDMKPPMELSLIRREVEKGLDAISQSILAQK